jgi:hypothetical protein
MQLRATLKPADRGEPFGLSGLVVPPAPAMPPPASRQPQHGEKPAFPCFPGNPQKKSRPKTTQPAGTHGKAGVHLTNVTEIQKKSNWNTPAPAFSSTCVLLDQAAECCWILELGWLTKVTSGLMPL